MRARTLIALGFSFYLLALAVPPRASACQDGTDSPCANFGLQTTIGSTTISNGDTVTLPLNTVLPVTFNYPQNNFMGILTHYEYALSDLSFSNLAYHLDFYKGTLFSNANFLSSDVLNDGIGAEEPRATSSVQFFEPGNYSAVYYESNLMRVANGVSGCNSNYMEGCMASPDWVTSTFSQGPRPASTDPLFYYGVTNFTVTAATTSPTLPATPLVSNVLFLPGIEGSRLYEAGSCGDDSCENQLWEPGAEQSLASLLWNTANDTIRKLFLDPSGASVNDVYAKEDSLVDSVRGTDYYASFISQMNTLKQNGTINDWEPVAYDWRLSLNDLLTKGAQTGTHIDYGQATSTPYIEQTLRRLAASSKTGKVTIVAHSNGGLVAKALLQELGPEASTLVDKVIFVGVPQSGVPLDLGALLYGYDQGIPDYFPRIVSEETAQGLALNAPVAYHLLPSPAYLASIAGDPHHPIIRFEGDAYENEESAYGSTISDQATLDRFLLGTTIAPINPTLIAYTNAEHSLLDAWMPPAGIEVDQIAGWGVDTVAGIDFYTLPPIAAVALNDAHPIREYRPIFTEDGDSVVPVPSALMMAKTMDVTHYWLNLAKYNRDQHASYQHKNILEAQPTQEIVTNLIENSTSTLPEYITISEPPTLDASKKLLFILHSPLTLGLYDSTGNHTGPAGDGTTDEQIPGATYNQFGDVKYIIAPEGPQYTLKMNGLADGTFSIDLQELSDDDSILASSTIANVPTTANTLATLTISNGLDTSSPLSVDENGDGQNVISITPQIGAITSYVPPVPDTPPPLSTGSSSGAGSTLPPTSSVPSGSISIPTVIQQEVASTSDELATTTPATTTLSVARVRVAAKIALVKKKKPLITPSVTVPDFSQTAAVYGAVQPAQSVYSMFKSFTRTLFKAIHQFL